MVARYKENRDERLVDIRRTIGRIREERLVDMKESSWLTDILKMDSEPPGDINTKPLGW